MKPMNVLVCWLALFAPWGRADAGIILDESSFLVGVFSDDDDDFIFVRPAVPSTGNLHLELDNTVMTVNYGQSQSGQQTAFDVSYFQTWEANSVAAYVRSAAIFADWEFTALQDGIYRASGCLVATVESSDVYMYGALTDLTTGQSLFSSDNQSLFPTTPLVLGAPTGNLWYDNNTGSTTGRILAGHKYWLQFGTWNFQNAPGPDHTVSLNGDFHFQINGQSSTVPEPSSSALLAIGGIGGLLRALRRRREPDNVCS